jgi:transcriptional antiterminator NusG
MPSYQVGESVRIKAGPLADRLGTVESVDQVKRLLTVSVKIFGRTTPVELVFSDVEPAHRRRPSAPNLN